MYHRARTRRRQTWHLGFQIERDTHPKGCASAGPAPERELNVVLRLLTCLTYPSTGPTQPTVLADRDGVSPQTRMQMCSLSRIIKVLGSLWAKDGQVCQWSPLKDCFLCSELLPWAINAPRVQHPARPTAVSPPQDFKELLQT